MGRGSSVPGRRCASGASEPARAGLESFIVARNGSGLLRVLLQRLFEGGSGEDLVEVDFELFV